MLPSKAGHVYWAQRAADLRDPRGLFLQARVLLYGLHDTPKDVERAERLLQEAAELVRGRRRWGGGAQPRRGAANPVAAQGVPEAFSLLGNIQLEGLRGKKNSTLAREFYEMGVALNCPACMVAMPKLLQGKDESTEAAKLEWMQKAAALGSGRGLFMLATHRSTPPEKAVEYMRQSVATGYTDALLTEAESLLAKHEYAQAVRILRALYLRGNTRATKLLEELEPKIGCVLS